MRFYIFTMDELRSIQESQSPPKSGAKSPAPQLPQLIPHQLDSPNSDKVWLIPEFPPTREQKTLFPPSLLTEKKPKTILQLTSENTNLYFPSLNLDFHPNPELINIIKNRQLLLDEIPYSIEEIHRHACHGYVSYTPGLQPINGKLQCMRCGNRAPYLLATYPCFRCKQKCTYCRSCLMMGKVSTCKPLCNHVPSNQNQNHKAPLSNNHYVQMGWKGTLSYFQQKASDKLCDTINDFLKGKNEKDTFLSWAVCGAGKTEMLFHGIQIALQAGLNVLLATPRTDVVLELEPRFKEAFPNTKVKALYGGAEDRLAQGELTISTTHQVLRFYKAFDLVIIDEVDAFPYTVDEKLRFGIAKAKRDRSLTVFVTATPDEKLKQAAEKGEILSIKVARRYHKHPLPEPRYQWIGQWKKQLNRGTLPTKLLQWFNHHLTEKKQIFLFVPSVACIKEVKKVLTEKLLDKVESVHSADPERREKVLRFRKGETRVLITTTILERGVTVKGVQVGVLGAEDRIFTESALVQISGRAGRSPDIPTGDVVFFHYGKTEEMVKAVKHIREMNDLGEEELKKERRLLYQATKARGRVQ